MGQLVSRHASLAPAFSTKDRDDLKLLKKQLTKFEERSSATTFGWMMSSEQYRQTFNPSPLSGDPVFRLWAPDHSGVINSLSVFTAFAITSKATFTEKLQFLFDLYDAEDKRMLSRQGFLSLIQASLVGFAVVTGNPQMPPKQIQAFALAALKSAQSEQRDQRVSYGEWVEYATSHAGPIHVLCQFGTVDAAGIKVKYLRETVARTKVTQAQTFSQHRSESKTGEPKRTEQQKRQQAFQARLKETYKMDAVFRLKGVFDGLDEEGDGTVDPVAFNLHLRAMNFNLSGGSSSATAVTHKLTFMQALERAYPQASEQERCEMFRWVCPTVVDKDIIIRIKRVFDALDVGFQAQVPARQIIPLLCQSQRLREYVQVKPLAKQEVSQLIDLHTLLRRIFGVSHHHQMSSILSWGVPACALGKDQIKELEDMFNRFDLDSSGFISMHELLESFELLDIPQSLALDIFQNFDYDDDKKINLREFQTFYREICDYKESLATQSTEPQKPDLRGDEASPIDAAGELEQSTELNRTSGKTEIAQRDGKVPHTAALATQNTEGQQSEATE